MKILKRCKAGNSSTILAIPFINMNPGNMSTIFSTLTFSAEECGKWSQSCIVTFDQPLFPKASEIIDDGADGSSLISKVIVRLGGFHQLMSFVGSISRIMEDSGIENLWHPDNGAASLSHMLQGHAYARALRAYTLTAGVLFTLIREQYDEIIELLKELEQIYSNVKSRGRDDVLDDISVEEIVCAVQSRFDEISISRTAKLWLEHLVHDKFGFQLHFC